MVDAAAGGEERAEPEHEPEPEPDGGPTPVPRRSDVMVIPIRATSSTPPPADIPITPGLEANCVIAGAPKPTRDHIQRMLANARGRNKSSYDWPAEVVAWMIAQKGYDRDRPTGAGRNAVQPVPTTGRLWQVGGGT